MRRLLLLVLVVATTASARTIPDLNPSFAVVEGPGALYASPSGLGQRLDAVGCTITLTVLDNAEVPIAGYPFQDMWLDDDGTNELFVCRGGTWADGNTDVNGVTVFTNALAAGGSTESLQVYLAGTPLEGDPLPIRVNSPDLNADGVVSLADVGLFSSKYLAGFDPAIDYDHDGTVNLLDLGRFVLHLGDDCP